MPTYRFRIAPDSEVTRLAVGAAGVDFVLGEPVDSDEEALDVFETDNQDVANALATVPDLEQVVVEEDGSELTPEESRDIAVEQAVEAERARQAAVEAEGRAEAAKQSVPGNAIDVSEAVREAVAAEQPGPSFPGVQDQADPADERERARQAADAERQVEAARVAEAEAKREEQVRAEADRVAAEEQK